MAKTKQIKKSSLLDLKKKQKPIRKLSYYDIEGKAMDFVQDDKNLSKIRSKTLRQFCRFYRNLEIMPILNGMFGDTDEELEKEFWEGHSFWGAYKSLMLAKDKELDSNTLKFIKEYEKENKTHITRARRRNVYDYMNARRFIIACNKLYREMMNNMLGNMESKMSRNTTQKKTKSTRNRTRKKK